MLLVYIALTVFAVTAGTRFFEVNRDGFPKSPSITYYEHAMREGNYEIFQTSSICKCKNICIVKGCNTVSMETTGPKSVSCNVSTTFVFYMKLRKSSNAVTFANYQPSCGILDGTFYRFGTMNTADSGPFTSEELFDNAVSGCHNQVNSNLAIFKAKIQFDAFYQCRVKYEKADHVTYLMDLRYINGIVMWGDGTPYEASEISKSLQIERNLLKPYYVSVVRNGTHVIEATDTIDLYVCRNNPMDDN